MAFRVAGIGGGPPDPGRTSILRKRFREEKDRSEWALLDSKGKRVLRWFGPEKPSKERVEKEERRIQFFKHRGSSDGDWVPAGGGTEEPFRSRDGRRLLYVWNQKTGKHAYLDLDSDVVLTDEEARASVGSDNQGSPSEEELKAELEKKGLRPARHDEPGWYDRPLGVKMWVTDLQERTAGITYKSAPEYKSVEDFVQYLMDDERSEFSHEDLQALNYRTRQPVQKIRKELESYGLRLQERSPEKKPRGFQSPDHDRWYGPGSSPTHGGSPGKDWTPGMASDDPIASMALRLCASGDLVRIRVTEDPNTVTVEYLGRIHSAAWDDDENLTGVTGDENLLRAAMIAWDGSEQMEVSADDLAKAGGGWWAP